MKTVKRKLITLYYDKELKSLKIDFSYYIEGEFVGVSEVAMIEEDKFYNLIKSELELEITKNNEILGRSV